MVKEKKQGQLVLNQPAGHVESGESLIQAVEREVLEETGWLVETQNLLGFYSYTPQKNGETYHRACFICAPIRQHSLELDPDITETLWLSKEDILNSSLRSPLVTKCLEDYFTGAIYPLSLICDKHL